jgi:hypothetical protein
MHWKVEHITHGLEFMKGNTLKQKANKAYELRNMNKT